ERDPCVLIGLERLDLPAGPVQREHELGSEPLAYRLLRDQQLELPDELRVLAEREVGFDALLERVESQVLESPGPRTGERRLADPGERRPSPQCEPLAQLFGRSLRRGIPRLGHEPLEAMEIDRVGADLQQVTTRPREQGARREELPELGDVDLKRLD